MDSRAYLLEYEVRRRANSHLRPPIIVAYACYVFVRTFITNIYDHHIVYKYCVLFASKYLIRDSNSFATTLFKCLRSRAVHIEMLEGMTTDTFINALRCLVAIRGSLSSDASNALLSEALLALDHFFQ